MAETWAGNAIAAIAKTGFFDYAIPFILTFAVTEGILQKTNFFAKKKTNHIFSAILSLMMMPLLANVNILTYISKLVIVLVGIVSVSLIMGLMGLKVTDESKDKKRALWTGLILFLLIAALTFIDFSSINIPTELIYIFILAAVLIGVVFYITGGKQAPSAEKKATNTPAAQPSQPQQQGITREQLNQMVKEVKALPPEEREEALKQLPPQLAKLIKNSI